MGVKPLKPASLVLFEGNKLHRSKAEIAARQEAEKALAIGTFDISSPPKSVAEDPDALDKWRELEKLYMGFNFVTSADRDNLAQYCLTFSELEGLYSARRAIIKEEESKPDLETLRMMDEAEGIGSTKERPEIQPTPVRVVERLKETGVDSAINKKGALLHSLANALFLTPVSRIKAITPKPVEKKSSKLEKFGLKTG